MIRNKRRRARGKLLAQCQRSIRCSLPKKRSSTNRQYIHFPYFLEKKLKKKKLKKKKKK